MDKLKKRTARRAVLLKIDPELLRRIDAVAKHYKESRSNVLRHAVQQYLHNYFTEDFFKKK